MLLSLVGVLKDKCGYFSPYLVPQLSFKTFPYRLCSCGKTCDSSEIKLFLTCRWILSVIRVTVNWKWQIDSTLLGSFSSGLFILKQLKPGQSDQIQNSTKSSLRERYWGLQQMGLHPPSPLLEWKKITLTPWLMLTWALSQVKNPGFYRPYLILSYSNRYIVHHLTSSIHRVMVFLGGECTHTWTNLSLSLELSGWQVGQLQRDFAKILYYIDRIIWAIL